MPATWKRDRLAPIQGPKLPPTAPVWNAAQPARRQPAKQRGPWQKVMNVACAVAITASIAMAATPAHAQADPDPEDICDAASGSDHITLGALRYVAAVFEDAATKQERYVTDPAYRAKWGALEHVELRNDYLCDVPKVIQPTLEFMTLNLLIYVMDIMHI